MKNYVYPWARPSVTATVVLFKETYYGPLEILIGKRSDNSDAYPGKWCLPGGFLNSRIDQADILNPTNKNINPQVGDTVETYAGETIEQCAVRELGEETNIWLEPRYLELLQVYSDPNLDRRAQVINVCFRVYLDYNSVHLSQMIAGDDLQELKWININEFKTSDKNDYAFNHAEIIDTAISN